MYAFWLRADFAALGALCDRYLNAPLAGTDLQYRPLLGLVMLAFVRTAVGRSLDPAYRDMGYMVERESAFWVPVVRGRVRSGRFCPEEICCFVPYIWVDSAPAMCDGREVYGFPKECGELVVPRTPADPARFAVATWAIPCFGANSACKLLPLLELTRADGGPVGELAAACLTLSEAASGILGRIGAELFEPDDRLPLPTWTALRAMLTDVERGIVRTALLKQFRDCEQAGKACYQAIVEMPARVTRLRRAGFLDGVWRVRIHEFESHPIVSELGLPGPELSAPLVFWVDFSFVAEAGTPIVEHTVGLDRRGAVR